MFDDGPEERTPVSTEERDDLPFENLGRTETSLTDHLGEQLRMATDDPTLVAIGEAIIGNLDEDGYLRAEPAEIAEQLGRPVDEVEQGPHPRPGVRSLGSGGAQHPGVPAPAAAGGCRAGSGVGGDRREAHGRSRAPALPGNRARPQAAAGPDHGVGGGDPGPGAEAGPPVPRGRLALHRPRRHPAEDRRRLRGRPQRGRHPAPPRQLALPLAPARLRGRGQAVRGAEASLRAMADQERGAAAAHAAEGRHEPGEVPAGLPRPRPVLPAAPRPPRRRRGHRHARVHHQPRHHQQVHPDAAGALRAQVVLPQRHRFHER